MNFQFRSFTKIFCVSFLITTQTCFSGEIKTELKNQVIGGFIGSAVGAALGVGFAELNHNDLGDLRNLITYPLFGQAVGNSIGHFVVSEKSSPYPLLLSLASGVAITTLLTENNSKNLDGAYYRAVKPYGGDFTFIASLLLYQPILTTLCHALWPKSNTTLTLSILPNNEKSFKLNRSF